MEKKYGKTLTVVLIIAIIIIIGVLGYFAYRVYDTTITDKNAGDKVSEFDQNTNNNNNNTNNNNNNNNTNTENNQNGNSPSLDEIANNLAGNQSENQNSNGNSMYQPTPENSDTYYEGYKVIGTISIPTINVEYPILAENTSDTLKIAIVAVHPKNPEKAVNQVGNLVLWGHNYKNGTFFSDLGKLTHGDKVYIKDVSGTKLAYQVYNIYETTDSDFTYATRNTDGTREISLATCGDQAGKRTVIWAREVK